MQRHQRADHAMQRGNGVADGNADARRRQVRITGDMAQSAHRFGDGAKPGRSRYGPVCP
jgi:hypothetical protein